MLRIEFNLWAKRQRLFFNRLIYWGTKYNGIKDYKKY